ncbi:unnamed protein product, partial [Thlaspi arvense]
METSATNHDAFRGSPRRNSILSASNIIQAPISTLLEYSGLFRTRTSPSQEAETLVSDDSAGISNGEVAIRIIGNGEQDAETDNNGPREASAHDHTEVLGSDRIHLKTKGLRFQQAARGSANSSLFFAAPGGFIRSICSILLLFVSSSTTWFILSHGLAYVIDFCLLPDRFRSSRGAYLGVNRSLLRSVLPAPVMVWDVYIVSLLEARIIQKPLLVSDDGFIYCDFQAQLQLLKEGSIILYGIERALSTQRVHYGSYATTEQDVEGMYFCLGEGLRERGRVLCAAALVKPADLKSFGDGSTSLFFPDILIKAHTTDSKVQKSPQDSPAHFASLL